MKIILMFFLLLTILSFSVKSQNVVIVVIDGARYSETFGNPDFTYIPNMAALSEQGTYLDEIYNQHETYTSRAIPALWTGGWDGVTNIIYQGSSTQCANSPTLFEYFRKQKNVAATQCYYTLAYVSSLWLQSFHPEYGENYWPETISQGSSDNDVLATTLDVINNQHPQLLWVYLSDVDHAGHSGIWENYISAIQNADEIVNTLWTTIQADEIYKDNTTMIVTNDHGRHDDSNGGFSGHGCSCDGCRHIMFLALGPNICENFVSTIQHETADVAVTASKILDVNPEYSTGSVAEEIFKPTNIDNLEKDFKFFFSGNNICFELSEPEYVTLNIYDLSGRKIENLVENKLVEGYNNFNISNIYQSGIFLVKLQIENNIITKKIFISK